MTTNNLQTADVSQAEFWQSRYDNGETGWDIGQVSPPIKAYIDHLCEQGVDKDSHILIAGAGNAHEAKYLHELGFRQVIVVDFAKQPLANFAAANSTFPSEHLVQADFFALNPSNYQFDYIIEQTFFCAIDPSRRSEYAEQMAKLLKPTGELFGVLFDRDFEGGPPFGGHTSEYRTLLSRYFTIVTLAPCYNSIAPRQGNEVFIRLVKAQADRG